MQIPEDYEPGFNPRVIAERFLRSNSEENLPWDDQRVSSEESEGSEPLSSPTNNQDVAGTTELLNTMNIDAQNRCNSECIGSPPRRCSKGKVAFPLDAEERLARLAEQAKTNAWHNSANGNLILKQGIVSKRKVCIYVMICYLCSLFRMLHILGLVFPKANACIDGGSSFILL